MASLSEVRRLIGELNGVLGRLRTFVASIFLAVAVVWCVVWAIVLVFVWLPVTIFLGGWALVFDPYILRMDKEER